MRYVVLRGWARIVTFAAIGGQQFHVAIIIGGEHGRQEEWPTNEGLMFLCYREARGREEVVEDYRRRMRKCEGA